VGTVQDEPYLLGCGASTDQKAVKKLVGVAGIDVFKAGGFPGLVKSYSATSLRVTAVSPNINYKLTISADEQGAGL